MTKYYKDLFLLDVTNSVKTPITYQELSDITGISTQNLATYKKRRRYLKSIKCFLIDSTFKLNEIKNMLTRIDLPNELWTPCKMGGSISNFGRVKDKKGIIKIPANNRNKCLFHSFNHKRIAVSKLVAEHFLGPCPNGHKTFHKDGNFMNNKVENLYYKSNTNILQDMGRIRNRVPVLKIDLVTGEIIGEYESYKDAGIKNFLDPSSIRKASLGMTTHAGGFKWEIDNEVV